MKFSVTDLGYLQKAQIDLSKDLLVLCGTNNTGKTYFAYSIYGLYKFSKTFANSYSIPELKEELSGIFVNGNAEINLEKLFELNKSKLVDHLTEEFKAYLPTVFAAEKEQFSATKIKIQFDDYSLIFNKIAELELDNSLKFGDNITVRFLKQRNSAILGIVYLEEQNITNEFPKPLILQIVSSKIVELFYALMFNNMFIAPAERIAINIFSRELSERRNKIVDALLEYKDNKKTLEQASRYSLPIRESLDVAEKLELLQKSKSEFSYFSDILEKELLQGKIKVTKQGEVKFSPFKTTNLNLGIHLTASMVKSLSNLVFYFRHIAKPNDFIIIDEPELNLHPDNQRKIARIIAMVVNAGFKVLISTHSDYIIRELNNLMMLNKKGNEKLVSKLMKKYSYSANMLLDHNKVGSYLFSNNTVEELAVSNSGFEVSTIDHEINILNNSAREIYFALMDE